MKKYIHVVLKVLFSLLLITPILGVLGVFPEPTRELYNTDQAFAFIEQLVGPMVYINYLIAIAYTIALVALWTKREALAALLVLPIMVNIIGFHWMTDGGPFTAGAVMADLLLLLNLYFLWKNRDVYETLIQKRA